jgi:hypothetical protein
MAVLAAVMAASVWAAKTKLVVATAEGSPISPGTPFLTGGPGMELETELGKVECVSPEIHGVLDTNESPKADTAELTSFSAAEFGCSSSLGPPTVSASGFPWTVELSTKDAATIKGTPYVAIKTVIDSVECTYASKKVKGTFASSAEGVKFEIILSNQSFKLVKGESNKSCAKRATLNWGGLPVCVEKTPKGEYKSRWECMKDENFKYWYEPGFELWLLFKLTYP